MLRFLVSPRALALHAGMIAAVMAMAWLAGWQWDRAHSRAVDPRTVAAVPFTDLSSAGEPEVAGSAVGREVTARGTYDAAQRFVVVQQPVDGARVSLDLAILVLPDGAKVPVARGIIGDATAPSTQPLPRGPVEIVGRIQPSDDLLGGQGDVRSDLDAGVLSGIATSELVAEVGRPLHPGWIALAQERSQGGDDVAAPPAIPDAALLIPDAGLRVQNVLYTVQWAAFGIFVLLVYRRFMMDAWETHLKTRTTDIKETV